MKQVKEEASWDKKKIFIISAALLFIVLFLSYRLIEFNTTEPQKPSPQIRGVSADDISKNVVETISNLHQQAQSLDVEEVATSSPQVQKIINDLKSLKDVPKSQLKSTCERICNDL